MGPQTTGPKTKPRTNRPVLSVVTLGGHAVPLCGGLGGSAEDGAGEGDDEGDAAQQEGQQPLPPERHVLGVVEVIEAVEVDQRGISRCFCILLCRRFSCLIARHRS